MNIKTLEKMSTAIYIAVEDSIANDISDGIKWAISRIKELELENERLEKENHILINHIKDSANYLTSIENNRVGR